MTEITDNMSADEVRALVREQTKAAREQTMDEVLRVGRRKAERHRWCEVYDQDVVPALREILVTKRTIEVDLTVTDTFTLTINEDLIDGMDDDAIREWLIQRVGSVGIDIDFGDRNEVSIDDGSTGINATVEATAVREQVAPPANEHGAPRGYAARATSDGRVLHFIPRDIAEGGGYAYSLCERTATSVWLEARNAPRVHVPVTVCKACQARADRLS